MLFINIFAYICFFAIVAVVSDNDGSAFITKAEFDSLKNNFQAQIDNYNQSIDSKIDGAIAAYLAGIRVESGETGLSIEWAVDFPSYNPLIGGVGLDLYIRNNMSSNASANGCIFAPTAVGTGNKLSITNYWMGYWTLNSSPCLYPGFIESIGTAPNRLVLFASRNSSSYGWPLAMRTSAVELCWMRDIKTESQWADRGYTLECGDLLAGNKANRSDYMTGYELVDKGWSEAAGWDVIIMPGAGKTSLNDGGVTSYIPLLYITNNSGNIDWKYYLGKNSEIATYKCADDCIDGGVSGLNHTSGEYSFILKRGSTFIPITETDKNLFRETQKQVWVTKNLDVQAGDQILFAFKNSFVDESVASSLTLVMDYTNYNP